MNDAALQRTQEDRELITLPNFMGKFKGGRGHDQDIGLEYLFEFRPKALERMMNGNSASRKLGKVTELVSARTARAYRTGSSTPKSVAALDDLADLGFTFPLKYGDEMAAPIFALYTQLLFGGTLYENFLLSMNIPAVHKSDIEAQLKPLTVSKTGATDHDYHLKKATGGMGRIVHELGMHFGSYGSQDISTEVFDYLAKNVGKYKVAVAAVVNTLFYNKLFTSGGSRSPKVFLPTHSDEEIAKKVSSSVEALMMAAFPGLDFKFSIPETSRARRTRVYNPQASIGNTMIQPIYSSDLVADSIKGRLEPYVQNG